MEQFSATITGRVADDPYQGVTKAGTAMIALTLQVSTSLQSGDSGHDSIWVRVIAFGALAARAGESIRINDRVTARVDGLSQQVWISESTGKAGGRITFRAFDIAASMQSDTLTTGQAARRAARGTAAACEQSGLPAAEQADLSVLAGVTANAA